MYCIQKEAVNKLMTDVLIDILKQIIIEFSSDVFIFGSRVLQVGLHPPNLDDTKVT